MQSSESEVQSARQRNGWRKLGRLAAFPLFVSIACLWMASSDWRREQRLMQAARPIQAELEMYRQKYRRYPESLAQIGIVEKLEGPIYYQRETEGSYMLWFGMELGESKTFHSEDGKWY